MTYFVLRHWYRYHMRKFRKWDHRRDRIKEKQGTKIFRQRYVIKVWRKQEYHRFWVHNYCELMQAYGHEIVCIHFGEDENTTQSGRCPYRERFCDECGRLIYLQIDNVGTCWQHYLSYEEDGFTPITHRPRPMLREYEKKAS